MQIAFRNARNYGLGLMIVIFIILGFIPTHILYVISERNREVKMGLTKLITAV